MALFLSIISDGKLPRVNFIFSTTLKHKKAFYGVPFYPLRFAVQPDDVPPLHAAFPFLHRHLCSRFGRKTEPNSYCNDSSLTRTISHSASVRMNESAKELSCRRIKNAAKCIVDFWEPWEETCLFLYGTWKLAFTVDFFIWLKSPLTV